MTQGTISILFGCHSPIHSIMVTIAWIKIYKRLPMFWELCCIFLHDIGHYGKNYLDNPKEKEKHWILGAKIALHCFGLKGYNMIQGHCSKHENRSLLWEPDKLSWCLAPKLWLYSNCLFEPNLRLGTSIKSAVDYFKKGMEDNRRNGFKIPSHDFYLRKGKGVK